MGIWVWCGEANYHDPAAAAARSSKEQSAVSSSVVYTSIMNNMSSLSVCQSVNQSMVGGREGGEREVEVSLFLKYYIVSPSLFPSFPFILLSTTTLGR